MSTQQTICAIAKGFVDSIKGFYFLFSLDAVQQKVHAERLELKEQGTLRKPPSPTHRHGVNKEEPRLLCRVAQCCCLNGLVFGLSIVIFNKILLPCLQILLGMVFGNSSEVSTFWYWLHLFLRWTFDALWVLPLFLLSRSVNALWFQDIGSLAYRYSVGRPRSFGSISTFIADNLFSIVIQFLFLIQAFLVSMIPLFGLSDLLYIFHMCLLYSLYAFEYKWIQMGWVLHQRLYFIESNWPYFFGFGLPLTLLTYAGNDFVIGGCLFAIVFPIFIISGNEAEPMLISDNPSINVFSFVVSLSNAVFSKSYGEATNSKR